MSRKFLPLNQIHDGVKGWTVLVQVVERGHVQLSRKNKSVNYRRFLFTDSEGTKVSAVIYGNDIRYFAAMLMPFKRYYISSAALRGVDPKYKVSDYQYSWVIHNRTLVEEYMEQVPPPLPCHFDLQKFKSLFRFADTENLQNIMGVVVHAFPSREQSLDATTRDFVIVNEKKILMLLTLWNEFEANEGAQLANTIANGNIIIAMRIKVTTFNYLSMTTRLPSCLLLNPPSHQTILLKQWYNQNQQEIECLVQKASYKDSSKLLPPPEDIDIISVKNAVNMLKNIKTAWIRGNVTLATGQRSFWYSACMNCQKAVDAPLEWVITCPSCKEENGVEARCRFGLVIDDGTSSMTALVFGTDAEKLIPFTGVQLSQAHEQGLELFSQLASAIANHQLLCLVRHFESEYQGHKDGKYSIVKVYTTEELNQLRSAITNEATMPTIDEKPFNTTANIKSSPQSSQQPSVEKQFFSPTTKMVLDSINKKSDKLDATEKTCSSQIAAKRSLTSQLIGSSLEAPTAQKSSDEHLLVTAQNEYAEDKMLTLLKEVEMSPLKKR